MESIAAGAQDISESLKESELPERKALIETFVRESVVMPGKAAIRYNVPMPSDSHTPRADSDEILLGVQHCLGRTVSGKSWKHPMLDLSPPCKAHLRWHLNLNHL